MSTVSAYTQSIVDKINNVSTDTSTTSTKTGNSAEEIQNRFLKLLTTQLKSQDPLNPMDNSQMTTQMSQISTVSGLEKLNETVAGMTKSQLALQSLMATSVIGKKALSAYPSVTLQNGGVQGMVKLTEAADKVSVEILNASGSVVRTLELPSSAAGTVDFAWDGKDKSGTKVADGEYSVRVTATQGKTAVEAYNLRAIPVSAVTFEGGAPKLLLASGQKVDVSSVELITG